MITASRIHTLPTPNSFSEPPASAHTHVYSLYMGCFPAQHQRLGQHHHHHHHNHPHTRLEYGLALARPMLGPSKWVGGYIWICVIVCVFDINTLSTNTQHISWERKRDGGGVGTNGSRGENRFIAKDSLVIGRDDRCSKSQRWLKGKRLGWCGGVDEFNLVIMRRAIHRSSGQNSGEAKLRMRIRKSSLLSVIYVGRIVSNSRLCWM